MRVLIVGPALNGPGGVQNYYRLILPKLPDSVEYLQIGRVARGSKNSFSQLWEDLALFKKKISNFDLVIFNPTLCSRCFFRDIPFFFLARKSQTQTIVFFRGWRQNFEKKITRWLLPIFRVFYNKIDGIIVLASEFKQTLRKWGYTNPIWLEQTVVDDSWFEEKLSTKEKKDTPFRILFLSRIETYKGIYELADGLSLLPKGSFICEMVGDGSEFENFKKYVSNKKYDFFLFMGYLNGTEKRKAYQRADLFILPSYTEGLPNSLLEAMASGLPAIVSSVGGIPDFFKNEKMGVLLEQVNAKEIASAVQHLLDNPEKVQKIGLYNYQYAFRFCTIEAAKRLLKIFEKIISNKGN